MLYESKGKIIGQPVLSVENGVPKQEMSIWGIQDRFDLIKPPSKIANINTLVKLVP